MNKSRQLGKNAFFYLFFALSLAVLFLSGCTAKREGRLVRFSHFSPPQPAAENLFWWTCRFRIHWAAEKPSFDSAVDLLLADAVVEPVLNDHANELFFWRFHRRAGRDAIGHQFSFLFYARPDTARRIFRRIEQSPILAELSAAGIVEKTLVDNPDAPHRPLARDTSDTRWPESLQKNWPAFIMGVSALWLGLINDAVAARSSVSSDFRGRLDQYREAEDAINTIWWNEGQHAFLHHLNALFGYRPLLIRKGIKF